MSYLHADWADICVSDVYQEEPVFESEAWKGVFSLEGADTSQPTLLSQKQMWSHYLLLRGLGPEAGVPFADINVETDSPESLVSS